MSKLYLLIATLGGLFLLSACGGIGPNECYDHPWQTSCQNDPLAISQRQKLCLITPDAHPTCGAEITNYCHTKNPLDTHCTADERITGCLANPVTGCLGDDGFATPLCLAEPFNPSRACRDAQFHGLRLAACQANPSAHSTCRQVLEVHASAPSLPTASSYTAVDSVTESRVNGIDVYTRASGFVRIPAGQTLNARGQNATKSTNERAVVVETLTRRDDARDGLTVFAGSAAGDARSDFAVAGLLVTTNVGAPLPNTAGKTAVWSGQYLLHSNIRARSLTHDGAENIDFNIDFEGRGITASAATSRSGQTFNLIDTTFNARGVISGSFGTTRLGGRNWTSEVLGLIGDRGLVGLLHGTFDNPLDDDDAEVYAGGFVADRDRVFYGVWRDDANIILLPSLGGNQFVQGVVPSATNGVTVAFDSTDNAVGGVAAYRISNGSGRYAGLHAGITHANVSTDVTDVGARLTQYNRHLNGIWRGSLALERGQGGLVRADMGLAVEFGAGGADGTGDGGGRISAFVKVEDAAQNQTERYLDNTHLLISGTFNSDGLLTGTTQLNDFPQRGFNPAVTNGSDSDFGSGRLSGLIGTDGAAAAIISDRVGATRGYAGGFIAVPTGRTLGVNFAADYATWAGNATVNVTASPSTATTSGFLRSTDGTLSTDGASGATVTTLTLADGDLGGDSDDGVAFFVAGNNYFAGVLSGTSLGAPLPDYVANIGLPATAVWPGRFVAVGRGFDIRVSSNVEVPFSPALEKDFNLEVNFVDQELEAYIFVQKHPNPAEEDIYYHIRGRYDDSGVILPRQSGYSVRLSPFSDGRNPINGVSPRQQATLSGLIGQEGAVGAFHYVNRSGNPASSGAGISGGFVARPPSE